MKYIIYNSLSNNNHGKESAEEFNKQIGGELIEGLTINYGEFLSGLSQDDSVYIVGGDGTIARLINQLGDRTVSAKIFYKPAGTGNDFFADVNYGKDEKVEIVELNKYIEKLPSVTINGETRKFINGVGFGLDGVCCEVGDALREKGEKKINYTSIAIKQLLFLFKKRKATVTVDGKVYEHKNVWIAPTMKGRFYGGGMIVAPEQDRFNPDGTVSMVIFKGASRLATLMVFPKIFKGEHVKSKKRVQILTGKEITVEFDKPCSAQVDGDTVLNVKKYTVKA